MFRTFSIINELIILQVDIVQQFKDMQSEMNQLADVQLPTLEVDDVKSLALKGWLLINNV